jgi:hypothetical protein
MQNRQGQNRNTARGGRGQNANQNQMGGAGNQQQQRTVRPQLIVAFSPPRPAGPVVAARLATRFKKLSMADFDDVAVEVEGSKVILRGQVDTLADSRKAVILARLEPGVRKVENQLTVREPVPASE